MHGHDQGCQEAIALIAWLTPIRSQVLVPGLLRQPAADARAIAAFCTANPHARLELVADGSVLSPDEALVNLER